MGDADTIPSRIEQVTVFAHGARIRRSATWSTAALPDRVRIVDLPVAVLDDTVRAEVEGPAVVVAVRVALSVPGGDASPEESPAVRTARMRVDVAAAEVQRIEQALDRLAQGSVVADDSSDEPPAAWDAIVRARRELVAARAERQLALRDQLAAARKQHTDAQHAFEVAAERDGRHSTAQPAKLHETRKHVELELRAAGGSGDVTIRIEYQVAAARWSPSYVARLDGEGARFELRALVAQSTGEDWTGVALRLSTAEPDQFAVLPELHAQKIGRRQPEPPRRGFRAPPAGAETLYADFDAAFPRRPRVAVRRRAEARTLAPPAPPPSAPMPMADFGAPVPMLGRNEPMLRASAVAAPAPARAAMTSQVMAKKTAAAPGSGGGGGADDLEGQLGASAGASVPRLDYGNLRMAPPSAPERGRLVPAPVEVDRDVLARIADAAAAVSALALPSGHVGAWSHTYDYAFDSDGAVDVASDGAWHSLALTARAGAAALRHIAVPREQPDVFRVAHITNPFDGPLLPGPIDVYDRGQFLLTSAVEYTPPGGRVDVGLGVDPAVKVARNAEFREEAAGMLRGALKLHHSITIDVENLSARPIDLEVRERIPVKREGDDDVDVTIGRVEPAWAAWTPDADAPHAARLRGGHRWRVELAARSKKQLRAAYEIKIAGKHELVGGNRREP